MSWNLVKDLVVNNAQTLLAEPNAVIEVQTCAQPGVWVPLATKSLAIKHTVCWGNGCSDTGGIEIHSPELGMEEGFQTTAHNLRVIGSYDVIHEDSDFAD